MVVLVPVGLQHNSYSVNINGHHEKLVCKFWGTLPSIWPQFSFNQPINF